MGGAICNWYYPNSKSKFNGGLINNYIVLYLFITLKCFTIECWDTTDLPFPVVY